MDEEKIAVKYALQAEKGNIAIKPETTSPYASISVAAHLLEEVKDIRDELNILKSLLRHQKTVWDDLFKVSAKNDRRRSPDYAMEEIEEMDRSAKRIQDSVWHMSLHQQSKCCLLVFLGKLSTWPRSE